jgi:ABC-type sulfate transport system permease subunit
LSSGLLDGEAADTAALLSFHGGAVSLISGKISGKSSTIPAGKM